MFCQLLGGPPLGLSRPGQESDRAPQKEMDVITVGCGAKKGRWNQKGGDRGRERTGGREGEREKKEGEERGGKGRRGEGEGGEGGKGREGKRKSDSILCPGKLCHKIIVSDPQLQTFVCFLSL